MLFLLMERVSHEKGEKKKKKTGLAPTIDAKEGSPVGIPMDSGHGTFTGR